MPSLGQKLASPYHRLRPSSPPPSYAAAASSSSTSLHSPAPAPPPPPSSSSNQAPSYYGDPLPANPRSRSGSGAAAVAASLAPGTRTLDSSASSTPKLSTDSSIPPGTAVSALHPQVAVILGVKERWHIPLQLCRCFSMGPAIWWGLKCLWIFVQCVLVWENGRGGFRVHFPAPGPWDLERRVAVTEVLLATVWCAASAYLSFFFADCLMSRWLLLYDAKATIIRLSTISMFNIYLSNRLMHFCNITSEPSRLLPAWIFITVTLTVLYHITQRHTNIKRETSATRRAFWFAMEVTIFVFLLQLHFPFQLFQGVFESE